MEIVRKTLEAMTLPFTISMVGEDRTELTADMEEISPKIALELERLEEKFSAFRETSLVSRYQAGDQSILLDPEFQEVYALVSVAVKETKGAFDPYYKGTYDPTGLVKGWVVERLFHQILKPYLANPAIEAVSLNGGGDMQFATKPSSQFTWKVGIENPHDLQALIAKLSIKTGAIATSGYSKRGSHIVGKSPIEQLTIIDIGLTRADVWATAGLAMDLPAFHQAIAANRLSGLYVLDGKAIHFQHGEMKND